jgi:hypothetical protein
VKFNCIEEAEMFIERAEENIQEAKEYIEKIKILDSEIYHGAIFKQGSQFIVILETGYGSKLFSIAGLNDKINHYSNLQEKPKKEIAAYLSKMNFDSEKYINVSKEYEVIIAKRCK